jgi:putative iron-dependent peroxidase
MPTGGWLYSSRFWLLTIRDGRENDARKWSQDLSETDWSSASLTSGNRERIRLKRLWRSCSLFGDREARCKETEAHPFPSPFQSGMGSELRELLLRDCPRKWRWSDVDGTDCVPA